ncbi:MAG: UvrD-helicase domain-containing protein [Gemmatimonadetes bacterium]|nr:UvrD-helicase domain-containing protein [Gemmatimonadota bacterium]
MTEHAWTDEQRAAILADHDLLLTANAGTGKTTTVVGKILWLLGIEPGLDPCPNPCSLSEIAAITFTEKAAHDLKAKLRAGIARSPRAAELLWQIDRAAVGTIHGYCGQILREHALRLGIDPTFRVLDERQSRLELDAIIRELILERLGDRDDGVMDIVGAFTLEGYTYSAGAVQIVRAVLRDLRWHAQRYGDWVRDGELDTARLRELCDAWTDVTDDLTCERCAILIRLAHIAHGRWQDYLVEENVRDFDALILDTRDLLTGPHGDAARGMLQRRYRILIIDEFQDTDAAQRDIAYAIGRHVPRPQLFFVGDAKQSIYRFRGADISVWNSVAQDLGTAGTFRLTRNFRSDERVIRFVNRALEAAIDGTGEALEAECPGSRIEYSDLVPFRTSDSAAVEWIQPEDSKQECAWVAARIEEIVGRVHVTDPDSGESRPCRYSDIAVLYRTRTQLPDYLRELRGRAIPFYEQGQAGLSSRMEVLDMITFLRLIQHFSDDVSAFAFLRSPFVGLRDETIARIRLTGGHGTLLEQASRFLRAGEWFDAPEHPDIAHVERDALEAGLTLLDTAGRLRDRVPLDELLRWILEESGYRAHLHLLPGTREAIANLHGLIRVAEEFRGQPLGSFLELWDRWDAADQGLPQAPLYSNSDDVVTLSTIHSSKGLEWPVVFLISVGKPFADQSSNDYWSDPQFGPLLCPKQADRGLRATRLAQRRRLEEAAEETRLLYVATTRARDRLIVVGGEKADSFGAWLAVARDLLTTGMQTDPPPAPVQVDASAIDLDWLSRVQPGAMDRFAARIPMPALRWITSATEEMQRRNNPDTWAMVYVHGVQPHWHFVRRTAAAAADSGAAGTDSVEGAASVPAHLHGSIVHGVLERIREEDELSALLDETIGDLASPELETLLAEGTLYRTALETEIRDVIRGSEWKWYVDGEHYRELPFLHLVGARDWRTGAFDLYRPDQPEGWIIDFKTHDVRADQVDEVARSYAAQAEFYRAAAGIRGPARVRLHFTRVNSTVDMA